MEGKSVVWSPLVSPEVPLPLDHLIPRANNKGVKVLGAPLHSEEFIFDILSNKTINRGPGPKPHPVSAQYFHAQGAGCGGLALLLSSDEDDPFPCQRRELQLSSEK